MFKIKLFSLYLSSRKPLLIGISFLSLILVVANQWTELQAGKKGKGSWEVKEVLSGETLALARDGEQLEAKLCGIDSGNKEYLRSLIDRGNGSVWVQKSGKGFEAWVMLKPDFESQIHLNTEMVMAGAILSNHSDCLSAENLELASNYEN